MSEPIAGSTHTKHNVGDCLSHGVLPPIRDRASSRSCRDASCRATAFAWRAHHVAYCKRGSLL